MKTLGERIKAVRLKEKIGTPTLAKRVSELAKDDQISSTAIQDLEKGDSRGSKLLVPIARALGRNPDWLYDETGPEFLNSGPEAKLIGKIGAGKETIRFDQPEVLEGIKPPPGMGECNAVEITGDSQYPLQEGWLIFYGAENEGIKAECIGKLCVVQVKDGPFLLKTLVRGSKKGLWRLESWNAPPREDQRVEWAARVLDIRPR